MGILILLQKVFFLLAMFLLPLLIVCDLQALKSMVQPPFPTNFLFGTASSSYQFEGAYLSDGKGLNNWDVYTHKPGDMTSHFSSSNIIDGSNGDVAVDHYHLYPEDIDLMASLGVNGYRFSISWARILPKGKLGDVNLDGINFYNKLIDGLLHKGIQPFVTLTHFDIPQELEEKYGGWLSPKSQEEFGYFAEICFKLFGDRVKYWATFNEPNCQVIMGYRTGEFPPSGCSSPFGNCTHGDSEREPFVAAHNIILAHAAAVQNYRTKFQKEQEGSIGIVLHAAWFEPISNSTPDKLAAERAQSFFLNWFLDPIIFRDYPAEMKEILGSILPEFSSDDREILKNGLDFIGINQYTSFYVQDCISSICEPGPGVTKTEGYYRQSSQKDGMHIGEPTDLEWLNVYPLGMEKMVICIVGRYNNIPMFITENVKFIEPDKNSNVSEYHASKSDSKLYQTFCFTLGSLLGVHALIYSRTGPSKTTKSSALGGSLCMGHGSKQRYSG
ncbi:hypothetical protein SO802_007498 [Lithocarpus litseifolius]|uniref:Uncharacterized protein n=1 Tax=Lithocarpus litseifolius TaxID=425828 RepID=A0AAW2DNT2_9ROSI